MKTVSGKIASTKPVSLSKAAKIISNFVVSEHEASPAVAAYLMRTSAAFNELVQLHKELKSDRKKKGEGLSNTEDVETVTLEKKVRKRRDVDLEQVLDSAEGNGLLKKTKTKTKKKRKSET